jgi:hypothetical protein
MPLLRYFVFVGGFLLCAMFVLDVYLPKPPPREQPDLDRTMIRIKRNTLEEPFAGSDISSVILAPSRAAGDGAAQRRTRQAFAEMPKRPRHKRHWNVRPAERIAPNLSASQPYRLHEDFPTW